MNRWKGCEMIRDHGILFGLLFLLLGASLFGCSAGAGGLVLAFDLDKPSYLTYEMIYGRVTLTNTGQTPVLVPHALDLTGEFVTYRVSWNGGRPREFQSVFRTGSQRPIGESDRP